MPISAPRSRERGNEVPMFGLLRRIEVYHFVLETLTHIPVPAVHSIAIAFLLPVFQILPWWRESDGSVSFPRLCKYQDHSCFFSGYIKDHQVTLFSS